MIKIGFRVLCDGPVFIIAYRTSEYEERNLNAIPVEYNLRRM
jgi:hypothetical protein